MKSIDIRPDVREFLDILKTTPMAHLEELGVDQARSLMEQVRAAQPPANDNLAIIRNFECDGHGGPLKLRLYDARADRDPGPVMVYFHGGGFVLGDLDSHQPLCVQLARFTDLPVVSVNYRLAPENPWPAAPEDAESAARWVAAHASKVFGRSVTTLVLAGDSSGGNLAAVTARALVEAPAALPVAAQFLIYPTTGDDRTTSSKAEFAEGFFLTQTAIDWFNAQYAAPRNHPRYDLRTFDQAGMPPTVLVTTSLDPLRDEGRAYAGALIASGVPVIFLETKGNIHGSFSMSAAIPSTVEDIRRACDSLRLLLNASAPVGPAPQ
jgi:acetyl esterase